MCANIYSIKQTCFRESDIGILDYWTEQMRIKTQKGTLCFHQLLPGSVAMMCIAVENPIQRQCLPAILEIQYKDLSF
jgi:hypothetical protein